MALTLAKIATNTASVTLHYSGEDILMMQALSETAEASAGLNSLTETLARLIKAWTLYEDAEETVMFPLDPERMAELPISLISQAFTVIVGDSRPEAQATQNGRSPR